MTTAHVEPMGLVAVLSNIQTEGRFERLTRRDWRQGRRPSPGTRDLARDGQLKFGTVSGAVLAVLAEARSPLRYIEIHARVCELLIDTPIQKGSVKAFLSAEAARRRPRFIRVERGLSPGVREQDARMLECSGMSRERSQQTAQLERHRDQDVLGCQETSPRPGHECP